MVYFIQYKLLALLKYSYINSKVLKVAKLFCQHNKNCKNRRLVTRHCYKMCLKQHNFIVLLTKAENMAALYRKCFVTKRNKTAKNEEEYQYDIARYDDTYTVVKDVLKLVGLRVTQNDSPFIRFCWNIFYWFEFLNLFLALVLELINMGETAQGGSLQDAIEIFRMMPCVGYLLLAMCKSYKIVYYRDIYENLIQELRDMWPRGALDDEQQGIITRDLGQLHIVIKGYYWCNNFLMLVFLTPPFMEVMKRAMGQEVPLILPFFYWFPFDPFQRIYYEVILTFQTWHGLITIWFMLSGDLLFCIFMSHITTQFDLLSARIRKIIYVPLDQQLPSEYPLGSISAEMALNNVSMDSLEDREKQQQRELARIMSRHRALIRLSGNVEELFTFALLVNFFNSSIIICFCGFCCVIVEKWNEMVYKSFLITALSQTWLLCWYGQRLQESSVGVSHALYNSGWYQASKKLKSSIFIILHRAQKEVHVTTYGFSVVCLASYTTIIKSSWSYFTLLLNVYKQPNK